MAKFQILTSFKLTKKGLIIVGDIIEGEIHKGNWITFFHEGRPIKKEISAIEMVDKLNERTAHIGLLLHYESELEQKALSSMKLKKQTVEIEH